MMHDKFYSRYNMQIIDTGRKKRYVRQSLSVFQYPFENELAMNPARMETERVMTIEISESDLTRLVDDFDYYTCVEDPRERQEMIEREYHLRRYNPAVKKAWENYKMLLRLVAEGKVFDV